MRWDEIIPKNKHDQKPTLCPCQALPRAYISAVGDPNDNLLKDTDEPNFIRKQIEYDYKEFFGPNDEVKVSCVAVRGDTKGSNYDDIKDMANVSMDENQMSIALLITLGEFEFYTAGDQKIKNAENIVKSGAILDQNNNSDKNISPFIHKVHQ